jgi:hypothetical protein
VEDSKHLNKHNKHFCLHSSSLPLRILLRLSVPTRSVENLEEKWDGQSEKKVEKALKTITEMKRLIKGKKPDLL